MAEPKIVGIHGGKTISGLGAKPLPKHIISVRDSFRLKLQGFLRQLFDGADDSLFEMIDKASSSEEQELYFSAMRELRLQKKQIATTVIKKLLVGFNSIQNSQKARVEEGQDYLESLNLVDKEELEVSVAVEAMVNRLTKESDTQLKELCLRLSSLVDGVEIETKDLPASPYNICRSFVDACDHLEFGIRAKLIVLKLFQRYVLSNMKEVYTEINSQLKQARILPELSLSSTKKQPSKTSTKVDGNPSGKQAQITGVPVLGEGEYLPQGIPFNELRSLLHGGRVINDISTEDTAPQSNVIHLLTVNQNGLPNSLLSENDLAKVDFNKVLTDSLQNTGNGRLSNADSDTISLVSMLFDFILDDRQLQHVMKALIARLQIPILKVAMMDKFFFDRNGHPARKLLNEIASSALGWTEVKAGKTDRLKSKIEEVVNKILTEFDQDVSIFSCLLEDFSKFVVIENKRGKLVEQRTRDAEKGRAANELARKEVSKSIEAVLSFHIARGDVIPSSVERFLEVAWSRVLNYSYLNGGPLSDQWKMQIQVVKDLVWTVCPEKNGFDVRGKLLKMIPGVIRHCRIGLKTIMFDEFEAKDLIAAIEQSHVNVLNDLQSYEEFDKSELDDEAISELVQDTLDIEEELSKLKDSQRNKLDSSNVDPDEGDIIVDKSGSTTSSDQTAQSNQDILDDRDIDVELEDEIADSELGVFMNQVERHTVGTWFEVSQNGNTERCKLAAHIKAVDKYIFVNRSGIKVMERDKRGFAEALSKGQLQVLSDGLLFDRALESVIGSLRGVK